MYLGRSSVFLVPVFWLEARGTEALPRLQEQRNLGLFIFGALDGRPTFRLAPVPSHSAEVGSARELSDPS